MTDERLRVAVIGLGVMGQSHARVLRELSGAELVAVCDESERTGAELARLYGVPFEASHGAVLERVRPDAVVVATPTASHRRIALDALAAGVHVLVEKPISETLEQAEEMIDAAVRAGRCLAVGHVERYNPAVRELVRRVRAGELGRVHEVHARRLGPFPARVRDVGVVVDLATHDLDVMRVILASDPVRVYAEAKREIHTSREDMVSALLRFADDTMGLLEVNWLTPTKIRELYVTGDRGLFRVDYLTQDLFFYENASADLEEWTALSVLRGVSEGRMTRFAVRKVEPLRAELEAFIAGTRGGNDIVSGRDGWAALRVALAVVVSARDHRSVELGW